MSPGNYPRCVGGGVRSHLADGTGFGIYFTQVPLCGTLEVLGKCGE